MKTTAIATANSSLSSAQAATRMSSFDQKPANGGTPARLSEPIMNVTYVIGMNFFRPPIFRMSNVPVA